MNADLHGERQDWLGSALPKDGSSCLIDIGPYKFVAVLHLGEIGRGVPYVSLVRASTPPGAIADWTDLKSHLVQAFWPARPQRVLFFHPVHLELTAPSAGIDKHLLAAPARAICHRSEATGIDRIRLIKSTKLNFYPRYKAIYDAVYVERPVLFGKVRTEPLANLARCLSQGLLYEIAVDGRWAGVIAARHRILAGMEGIFMVEIVLDRDARGQHLGAAVHQLFAKVVEEAEPGAVIFGTISAKNPWSLRSAFRAGRVEVGAWHWVDL